MIFLYILAAVLLLILLVTFVCFLIVFYSGKRRELGKDEYSIPPGEVYLPYRDRMLEFMKKTRELPCEEVCIVSYDGLKLYGKFFEYAPGAPIEVMMPGYRGLAERDLCGGVQRSFALGRSVLLVDQRSGGKCEGRIISFGIRERHDCVSWVNFLNEWLGEPLPIILTGISMGAATVMMATELELPDNVVGVIADCGYTTPKEIICKVMRQLKLPHKVLYPFVKLAARLFGGFDLEAASPKDAMAHCKIPVFFAHGEDDDYVPCEMTLENYDVCSAPKRLLTVPGAGHGLSYLCAKEEYLRVLREMIPLYSNYEKVSKT